MHQSTTPSLSQTIWPRWASRQFLTFPIVQTLLPVTFGYSLRSLTHSHKRTSMGPSRSCWNGTKSALQLEEITSKGISLVCTINKSAHTRKSLETYRTHLVYAYLHPLFFFFLLLFSSPTIFRWIFLKFLCLSYLPTPPLGQDMTQGQFLSGV